MTFYFLYDLFGAFSPSQKRRPFKSSLRSLAALTSLSNLDLITSAFWLRGGNFLSPPPQFIPCSVSMPLAPPQGGDSQLIPMAHPPFLNSEVKFGGFANIRAAPNLVYLNPSKITPSNGAALSDGALYPDRAGAAEAARKMLK